MEKINYTTPLHNFGSNHSFTATKKCILTGQIDSGGYQSFHSVTINSSISYGSISDGSYYQPMILHPIKLDVGDTVVTSHNEPRLNVYEIID